MPRASFQTILFDETVIYRKLRCMLLWTLFWQFQKKLDGRDVLKVFCKISFPSLYVFQKYYSSISATLFKYSFNS